MDIKKENNISNNKRGRVFFITPFLLTDEIAYPPNDMLYLAAIAEECGYEAKIVSFSDRMELLPELSSFNPDYIVSNVSFQNFREDLEVLALLKEHHPSAKIIVKGEPFLTYNTNVTYENPYIDYVIVGDSEATLKDILSGINDSEILGICYTDENMQPVKNKPRPFFDEMDKLPFPARHLIDNSIYRGTDNKPLAVINVSKGCPYNCFFCLATITNGLLVRTRSHENIIEEIKECVHKYKIKNFIFESDIFNMDRKWTIDLCKKIIESGLNITWSSNIKPNTMDDGMASYMYNSGCRLVYLGVESGSQEILNNIGQKVKLNEIRRTVSVLKKNKIKIHSNFIIGLPWETEKTAEETIKFAIELDSNYTSFYIASPLPGTRFFAYAMMNKLIYGNIDFKNAYYEPIVRTHDLSKEKISEIYKEAYRRYYLRPKFIFKTILRLKNTGELKSYIKIYKKLLTKQGKNDR